MKYLDYQKKERAKVVRDVQSAYKKRSLPNVTGALNKYMAKCQSCSASLRPGQGNLMFSLGSSYKILCHKCHEKEINTDVPKENKTELCARTVNGFKIKKKFLSLCR
jgi:hypothetical protein